MSAEERIDLRVDAETRRLLRNANEAAGVPSSFVLGAATVAACELPADRTVFRLDEEQWQAFDTAVSRKSRDVPGLAELMRSPTVLAEKVLRRALPGGAWDDVIGTVPGFTEAVDGESSRDSWESNTR